MKMLHITDAHGREILLNPAHVVSIEPQFAPERGCILITTTGEQQTGLPFEEVERRQNVALSA